MGMMATSVTIKREVKIKVENTAGDEMTTAGAAWTETTHAGTRIVTGTDTDFGIGVRVALVVLCGCGMMACCVSWMKAFVQVPLVRLYGSPLTGDECKTRTSRTRPAQGPRHGQGSPRTVMDEIRCKLWMAR